MSSFLSCGAQQHCLTRLALYTMDFYKVLSLN
ncbi:hypothetical protein SAMN05421858_4207 [Haladaptatus litoreus]|uniref:Uncharacterized protein n=1 Tax=Haladaptatus litoreus TaxID=553468 RepID=A0A1N7EFU3_9EURY|nr:hypothetical protein SAMN05421858_4207 [Haladaptatus litoreus]